MSTAHTPGPWQLTDSGPNCFKIGSDSAGKVIGYTFPRTKVERGHPVPVEPTDEDWANANLMAAAPIMLEALKMALDVLETHNMAQWGTVPFIRAAIAEAEGE